MPTQRFVEEPPPAAVFERVTPCFTHNDLGIEHVLVSPDGDRLLGIIDWSDAAVTDPAVDFARILRDLGPGALDAALAAYARAPRRDPALEARIWFYARCLVLEDMAIRSRHRRLQVRGEVAGGPPLAVHRWREARIG